MSREWPGSFPRDVLGLGLSLPEMTASSRPRARWWRAWAARRAIPESRALGPAPAEVSPAGDSRWVGSQRRHSYGRPQSSRHRPAMAKGSSRPVPWVDAARDGQAAVRAADRQDDGGVSRPVVAPADQRLDDGPALHLVRAVLADRIHCLATNVPIPGGAGSAAAIAAPRGSSRACWGGGVKLACPTTGGCPWCTTPSPGRPRPGRHVTATLTCRVAADSHRSVASTCSAARALSAGRTAGDYHQHHPFLGLGDCRSRWPESPWYLSGAHSSSTTARRLGPHLADG